jgi:hypothetical protein
MIDCDEGMIVALLRNWRPNRLRPEGIRLSVLRPQLIKSQKGGVCPLCSKPLNDNGKETHIDHVVTVKEFADQVLHGKMPFDEAYCQLWGDSNLRAICRSCNYARKNEGVAASAF